jgi:hypothetical protein
VNCVRTATSGDGDEVNTQAGDSAGMQVRQDLRADPVGEEKQQEYSK